MIGNASQCSSCIGVPSSKETAAWLQELLNRKYGQSRFHVHYLDLVEKGTLPALLRLMGKEIDEWIFPVILIDGRVISEGIPSPKTIFTAVEKGSGGQRRAGIFSRRGGVDRR